MGVTIVIPARYGSTRLPGKMLLAETGKPLIQHTYEQALKVKNVDSVLVATDDTRIQKAVQRFNGNVVMTSPNCKSGTDRVAEVAEKGWYKPNDLFVNLQGDEPEIDPQSVTDLINVMDAVEYVPVGTLAAYRMIDELRNHHHLNRVSPNLVKAVIDKQGDALYFSRQEICDKPLHQLWHLGIYAYRKTSLLWFAGTPPTPPELVENLEQLRWLYHCRKVRIVLTDKAHKGIDTREDYDAFVNRQLASSPK